MNRTYVDATGAVAAWINGRTATLVGPGMPLRHGAHLTHIKVPAPETYAYLEELSTTRTSDDSPENPDMLAVVSAQVYGGTRKAATDAAVALAEELLTVAGAPISVTGALLLVADDVQGPSYAPDGSVPRLVLQFTVRIRPN